MTRARSEDTVTEIARIAGVSRDRAESYVTGERSPAPWIARQVEQLLSATGAAQHDSHSSGRTTTP